MFPSRVIVLPLLFCFAVMTVPAMAQTTNHPSEAGPHDYFKADQEGVGGYLRLVESAHTRTINKWLNQGRLDNAIGDIKYTLDRFPNHPVSLQQLSVVAQMAKNTAVAVNYFERAISLFPHYAITRVQYGLFLVSINHVDAGLEHLKQAVEIEPKLLAGYKGLVHAYVKKGDLDQARDAAKKARELGYTGALPGGL